MKALAEHCLDVGLGNNDDMSVYLNNAAILRQLCERHAVSKAILVRAMPNAGKHPQLRRRLPLARCIQDRDDEAIVALE